MTTAGSPSSIPRQSVSSDSNEKQAEEEKKALFLLFFLGDVMYTLPCTRVREIVPAVPLQSMPYTPEYFRGFFNLRNQVIPVIDLRQLIQGRPCEMRLSTRIIITTYERSEPPVLGLLAERVLETVRQSSAWGTAAPGMKNQPYLGGVIMEQGKMIRQIILDELPGCIGLPFLNTTKKNESEPGS